MSAARSVRAPSGATGSGVCDVEGVVTGSSSSAPPASVPSADLGDAALAAGFLDTQAVQWTAAASEPMRRRRHRAAARVSARIVGGWRELVDHARDLAPQLAVLAERHVFGPAQPADHVASAYWSEVDAERRRMSRQVTRRRRLRAALSLRTFR